MCHNCDASIEVLSKGIHFQDPTCNCDKSNVEWCQTNMIESDPNQAKEEKMQTVPYTYNPNALVTVKKIVDGEATYESIKVVDLEGMLFVDPVIDVNESHTDGTYTTHQMKRRDIMEMFRLRAFDKARLESQEKQIGKVLDNLTTDAWFNPNTEKEEILNDLCDILDYQPKKEIQFEGTIYFSGRVDVPLADFEDFDLDDMLSELSVDVYNGDIIIDEFHTEDVREV